MAMHGVYWTAAHPVTKFWLADQQMTKTGAGFFPSNPLKQDQVIEKTVDDWKVFRDRWECSHVVRAVLAVITLVALVVAVAI
jgi:hypothetical protein